MSRCHRLLGPLATPAGAALAGAALLGPTLLGPAVGSQQCNLTGWWKNDLGSKMHVYSVNSNGDFEGVYHTAVSSTENPIKPSPLHGSQHLDDDGQCTFGFTVNWKRFSDSTTVFVGQCFVDKKQEVLQTAWLLREKVDSLHDDWKATRTGHNVFVRINDKEEGKASPVVSLPT
ncbi:avidin-like isoform X2 [Rhea pennata]|uniref:avidin-like isoform X2 n=1 Tax=Rhea pennata TaxID=8795 RepID=UPI002E274C12